MISLIDLKRQYTMLSNEIREAITEVLQSGQYILGSKVAEFEKRCSEYLNVKHCIGVGNGTDALVIALESVGVGNGDEVITTPFTFFATAEAIVRVGAKPVFVDIDPLSYNINPEEIEKKVTPKTKAIIPVHIFGQVCDMDKILEIAKKYNLCVIEDACQAFGAEYNGKKAGTIGDVGCFSFFPTKNLGGFGDGGLIVTNDDEVAEKARMLRQHGSKKKYYNELIGFNSRLDEIQAAILLVKLKYIDDWNKRRSEIAQRYNQGLKLDGLITPAKTNNCERGHIYHLYVLQHERRDELIKYLSQKGIATGIYYPVPLHLTKALQFLGYKEGDFKVAEEVCRKSFAIPMFPELTEEEIEFIISSINEFGGSI
ncbi:Glutamine--scyllo-inositol transaminase [Caldicellulosiruptor saccharolyticus DSM 8903]|uniref:Glutamine--scyllo-inositol transaminase n=1 Tax=Caldicellulosiruptor saccharolyticus (strain ATCC 43494 / DSM 8903 / Tp8T 6331) TaxID=351627 RepID=A4XKF2_CALS8|nr:DegT/DnrJ/EryC1/StrS family aminotransferase [Caldicellulosiruptor saccharolyticus]ABP67387.1 Glutamine--scyllo-inositol transaminase [Caldicellulosiruptor saccharolyticus DSM 8903]